ncbi:MAG TPA: saccharopine dehydrogenase C-terminal domain-containing protein [Bacteroidia bacterium]|jgi:saccharopine dehydrogenase-like NADP-dependent oxidoreductase|nr:saccharopine dehydrogenase C-terminal domain-containing protein [Bacteroidia bacterium]
MKKILILGAGRSASSLITYLLNDAKKYNYEVIVADTSIEAAKQKTAGYSFARAIELDISDEGKTHEEISNADVVISMLPAFLHPKIASQCVSLKKSMVTASYVSPEMKALDADARKAGIILMNEAGLDPGIDHASAMKIIDHIKVQGGKLLSFKSYTGGLIAPESNNNPWGYKFTWNPRNVVLAGQGTAKYIEKGKYAYIPYHKLFTRIEKIHVEGWGDFEGYANRDSLSYRPIYGIENIPTLIRGTLRMPGYCEAWNVFVQLGMTDDSYHLEGSEKMTWLGLTESFLPSGNSEVKQRLADYVGIPAKGKIMDMLEWLGIFENTPIKLKDASPAQVLQDLLEEKWKLKEGDIDMIVMQHQFEYELNGKKKFLTSSLVVKGDDAVHTAMAKTVGLPIGILTKLIITDQIKLKGVCIPIVKEIYNPLLSELEEMGIKFEEKES